MDRSPFWWLLRLWLKGLALSAALLLLLGLLTIWIDGRP